MPKVIKNLNEKIYNSAFKLFVDRGYDGVDMKSIAKEVGIAVGTLYNYFPNKDKLFEDILMDSWDSTFKRVENELESKKANGKDRIKISIKIIYEDMEERKGLGGEVIKGNGNTKGESNIGEFKEFLSKRMKGIVFEDEDKLLSEYILDRFITSTLITMACFIRESREEKEKNIEYLNIMIDGIFDN